MSNGNTPRDDAEFDSFLARKSPVTAAYDAIEPVQPPEVLDAKILAMAKGTATAPVAARQPQKADGAASGSPPRPSGPVPPAPVPPPPARRTAAVVNDEDDEDDAPVTRRPRWMVPAALAASVLAAVGIGLTLLGGDAPDSGADSGETNPLGALFAKRARERSEAQKAAAEAATASQEAEVELAPLPPPPVFEPEGPQVEDLDTSIALIRRELVLANQMAAMADTAPAAAPDLAGRAAEAEVEVEVIQPRDRRLAKILELYDGGNPDLAAASLEIFLRDFEDDPISQRILEAQPRETDVAVE